MSLNRFTILLLVLIGSTFSVQAFAAPKACVLNGIVQNTKLLFVIDKSGSNTTTDPQGRRADALREIYQSHKSNPCVKWGVTVFQDPGTRTLTALSQKPAFLGAANAQIRKAIKSIQQDPDQGGTPLAAALSLTEEIIKVDLLRFPNQLNQYRVVVISDGVPTDGLSSDYLKQLVAEIHSHAPGRVKISSGFYGMQNGNAIEILRLLASEGKGKFVNFGESPFGYEDAIVP